MPWWKKGILSILSGLYLFLTSCSATLPEESKAIAEDVSKMLISDFYENLIQEWNDSVIFKLDSLGFSLANELDSISFLPYMNEYSPESFVFYTNHKNKFKEFVPKEYLEDTLLLDRNDYYVWRLKNQGIKILDVSLEPHPILNWTFNFRLRNQE